MFQECFVDGQPESINKITEGDVECRGGVTCTTTNVKQGDVKEVGLPGVGGGDECRVRGVSFEGGDCGKDGWLAKEIFVGGKLNNKWCFAFSNRPPNLLSVKFDEEVLVRVDRRRVLNACWRKIRVKRAQSNRGKGWSSFLVAHRWRWR
jgi:hypothetical protein